MFYKMQKLRFTGGTGEGKPALVEENDLRRYWLGLFPPLYPNDSARKRATLDCAPLWREECAR